MKIVSKTILKETKSIATLGLGLGIAQLSQVLLNLFDSIMMGRCSEIGLAAGLLGSSIYNLGLLFCMGVVLSVTILISNNRDNQVKKIISSGYFVSILLTILMLAYVLITSKFLNVTHANSELTQLTAQYLLGLMPGVFPWVLFLLLRNVLSCFDKVKLTISISIFSLILDTILNFIFIFGFGNFNGFGVLGSAYSTSLTNWIALISFLVVIKISKEGKLKEDILQLSEFKLSIVSKYFKFGIPTGIIFFSEYLIFAYGNILLAKYGSNAVIAFGVAVNWLNLFYMYPVGVSQILTVKTGEAVKKEDKLLFFRRIKSMKLISLAYNFFSVLSILLFHKWMIFLIIGRQSYGSEVYFLSQAFLFIVCLILCVYNLIVMLAGVMRGFQDVKTPLYMVFLMYWIIGVGSSHIFSIIFSEFGILLGMLFGFSLTYIGMKLSFNKKIVDIFERGENYPEI